MQTEYIDNALLDLELRDNKAILAALAQSQTQAATAAQNAIPELSAAVDAAAERLRNDSGRLVMLGAGASGRLAVQDGAELWPTYGWPAERLLLSISGGNQALLSSVDGLEDDAENAYAEVESNTIGKHDVVLGLAASGSSAWTVAWIESARSKGALTIGMANNDNTLLLREAEHSIFFKQRRRNSRRLHSHGGRYCPKNCVEHVQHVTNDSPEPNLRQLNGRHGCK